MDLANPRPLFVIAGALFAGVLGFKIVRMISTSKKTSPIVKKPIETPQKKGSCVAIRNDKKAYFLEVMRLGEQCLAAGKYEEAVDHLANAILYCDNKESLNEIFMTSLPKPIYEMFQKALLVKTELQKTQRNGKDVNFIDKNLVKSSSEA